jgi:tRNA pseudouridine38-40 synthase
VVRSTDQPVPLVRDGLVRFRLDLGYDGTDFAGWAKQPGQRTVEGVLADAIGTALRLSEPPTLTVAGRTDAGVHARGQVAHVDLPSDVDAPRLTARIHGLLPPDLRLGALSAAPTGFHARFAATFRRYTYRVSDDPAGVDPLRRHEVVWHHRRLDVGAMNTAAAGLLGEHDFAAFCRKRAGGTTIRRLDVLSWSRDAAGVASARVQADAFCHNQVRAMVGALLAVGDGRHEPDWPARLLAALVRDPGVTVAPAHGLTLDEVGYPDPAHLSERVAASRQLRGAPCEG